MVGTAIFVFFGTAVVQSTHGDQDTGASAFFLDNTRNPLSLPFPSLPSELTMVALCHGLAIMVLVFSFDPIRSVNVFPTRAFSTLPLPQQRRPL